MKLYSKTELLEKIKKEKDDVMFLAKYETFDPSYINSIIEKVRSYLSKREHSKRVSDWTILHTWSEFYYFYSGDLDNSPIIEMTSLKISLG